MSQLLRVSLTSFLLYSMPIALYLTSETPMGQMPILEIDGIQIGQSVAMARYVANLVGLAGKNDWENLQIDIAVDNVIDFRSSNLLHCIFDNKWTKCRKNQIECTIFVEIVAAHSEPNEALRQKKLEDLDKETIPFYLNKLEAAAKENNGFLTLGRVSFSLSSSNRFVAHQRAFWFFYIFLIVDLGWCILSWCLQKHWLHAIAIIRLWFYKNLSKLETCHSKCFECWIDQSLDQQTARNRTLAKQNRATQFKKFVKYVFLYSTFINNQQSIKEFPKKMSTQLQT